MKHFHDMGPEPFEITSLKRYSIEEAYRDFAPCSTESSSIH
jgi:hypothetical protein